MHLAKKYTGSIYSISLINLDLKQRGWGNKTGPFDYLGYPIHLFRGELGKQDSYVSKGGPFDVYFAAIYFVIYPLFLKSE